MFAYFSHTACNNIISRCLMNCNPLLLFMLNHSYHWFSVMSRRCWNESMVNKSCTWRPGREAHHPLKSAGPHLGKTPEQPLCWHSWQGVRKWSTLLVMTASATPSRTSPRLGSSPPSILLKSFWLSEKMSQNTDTGWGRMIWSNYWIQRRIAKVVSYLWKITPM